MTDVWLSQWLSQAQVEDMLERFYASTKIFPYFSTILDHAVYGPVVRSLPEDQQDALEDMIDTWMEAKIRWFSTKWWQLFARLLDIDAQKFWQFRRLNEDEQSVHSPLFQEVGTWIESQLFTLEGILTAQMLKKTQGLDKTVSAFYDIAYACFPYLSRVGAE
jgi:hypothetical protein